jgi:putative peptidoglycan lipid II flippase
MPVSEQIVNGKQPPIEKKQPKLLKSTSVVAGMTLLSRILGFVRDVVLAQIFGAGAAMDAFIIALKLPNFMRRLFGEGAFSQAFVPVMSELREQRSHEEVQTFVNRVAGTLALSVLLVVLLAEILTPVVVMVFAPGFAHGGLRATLTTHMLHITFPYLFLIVMAAFSGAILNTCSHFSIPAFTPVLLNVALISVAYFWAPHAATPIYVLAWGLLIGGCAQLAIQLPALMRKKLLPRPRLGFKDPEVRRVMRLMVPALFGVSVAQISLLIDNFFASFLPEGSISWLYYSDRLTYLPLGVIGVALATVVLPNLSRHHSNDDHQRYSATLNWALRIELLVGIPAAVALFILAGPLLATLIHHGAFNTEDVIQTMKSLKAFAIGLPAFMLIKVLASAFYSRKDIRTPVKIAALAVIFNVVFILALIHVLRHAGLALSTSLAASINASLLIYFLLKQKIFTPDNGWFIYMLRLLVANIAMGVLIWWLAGPINSWLQWNIPHRIEHLIIVIVAGIAGYAIVLLLTGFKIRTLRAP